jgi:hypothetical protein
MRMTRAGFLQCWSLCDRTVEVEPVLGRLIIHWVDGEHAAQVGWRPRAHMHCAQAYPSTRLPASLLPVPRPTIAILCGMGASFYQALPAEAPWYALEARFV